MKESDAIGPIGFVIQRTDPAEDETISLLGNKTFASIRPATGIEDASGHNYPFQAFQWADYGAKTGYKYRYRNRVFQWRQASPFISNTKKR